MVIPGWSCPREQMSTPFQGKATLPCTWSLSTLCETQPPASIGLVALSSMFVRSYVRSSFVLHPWHLLSSPLYDVSDHTHHIFSEYMILATCQCQHIVIAELSPVYCLLFHQFSHFTVSIWSTTKLSYMLSGSNQLPRCAGANPYQGHHHSNNHDE